VSVTPTRDQVARAYRLSNPCRLCPRLCEVARREGETGFCRIGPDPLVSSAGPHYGEEPPLVGRGGSGTIFLAGCNLLCIFCQNHDISHGRMGRPTDPQAIAEMMLLLESRGCENVNFVTPTHVTPWLMDAVHRARSAGLTVPIVYNCGGYESLETLRVLEGTVDIYMPDAKFWFADSAERYCRAPDYPDRMREALVEMQRQVGDLQMEGGVATRGLLIRHLVMPEGEEETREILRFIAREVSANAYVNVMAQYRPVYRAHRCPEIARPITADEHQEACTLARELGLRLAR
jgi:putative pyruvate formate lyase activating enzyme